MKKLSVSQSRTVVILNKVFVELEGGTIFTLKDIPLSSRVVELKRRIKVLTKVPIRRQTLMVGKYELKNSSKIVSYPVVGEETIIKLFFQGTP